MILTKTYELLLSKYQSRISQLMIEDVRVGIFMTAVKLSDQSFGVASTITDDQPFCTKKQRDFSDFSPGQIKGRRVTELFKLDKQTGLVKTLKSAVLNAISAKILEEGPYHIVENADPVDLIHLEKPRTITIVGAFQSYIEKLSSGAHHLNVLELDESALLEHQQKYFVPAADFQKVVPNSEVVIITGFTLVNNTIDGLLSSITPGSQVVVTGPSSSLIPDILFDQGVTVIGATRITDPGVLLDVVGSGGKGYHLFKYCAQKISILPK